MARGLARVARVACSVARLDSVARVAWRVCAVNDCSILIERLPVGVVFPCACGFFVGVGVVFLAFFEFIF